MTDYACVLEPADDGTWSAYVPDLPGVVATGRSPGQAQTRIREAISLHLEELRRHGETAAPPRSQTVVVAV